MRSIICLCKKEFHSSSGVAKYCSSECKHVASIAIQERFRRRRGKPIRKRNFASIKAYKHYWYEMNKELTKARSRISGKKPEYRAKVREHYLKNKERISASKKNWSHKNKERLYKRHKERMTNDIQYRLSSVLRLRLNCALKGYGYKMGSAVKDLGCTVKELMKYLESKFTNGMNWENRGLWHIDHIEPLSSFDLSDRKQLLKACHYTNLQPLWAIENLKKGSNPVNIADKKVLISL